MVCYNTVATNQIGKKVNVRHCGLLTDGGRKQHLNIRRHWTFSDGPRTLKHGQDDEGSTLCRASAPLLTTAEALKHQREEALKASIDLTCIAALHGAVFRHWA
ncbi:hypothetical protein TNCV_704971 [Trichonephila clavipes]|nr:hypothetical protein TNCV_704971 [Trichonephila clavipes]